MNKDPAFLLYSSDFLVGTMLMSNEQVGKYIRLMCYAHQKGGYITEQDILNICGGVRDEELFNKFKFDGDGVYYNERLLSEIRKRSNYTESRRNNLKGNKKVDSMDDDMNSHMDTHMGTHMDKHMASHMENENISLNSSSISLKNNKDEIHFPYQEIIEYLNQKAKKKFRVVDKTRKLIQARFNEKFTLEDFKKVIDNQCAKWLNDPNMADYLRPETLFGTKFEGYLNSNGIVPRSNGKVENETEYPTIETDDVNEEDLMKAFNSL